MILPSDKDYQETKQIMLGNASMNPVLRPLADWIDKTYTVKTLNIFYDTMDQGRRPRISICLEFKNEMEVFTGKNGFGINSNQQNIIAQQFKELVTGSPHYLSDNAWIIYSAFEPIAKIDSNEGIPQDRVADLHKSLGSKDIWQISRSFSATTFFLYTDEQVKDYENSALRKEWTNMYFDLLKQYDDFGYFKRDDFSIYLDSKENFDTNYGSNWWYYYK